MIVFLALLIQTKEGGRVWMLHWSEVLDILFYVAIAAVVGFLLLDISARIRKASN